MKRLLIMALLASAGTWAADKSSTWKGIDNQPTFSQFDINNDGKITPKELEEGRTERIKQHAKEGRKMKNKDKASSFADIDTNRDGAISKEEFRIHKIKYPQGCVTFG
ncbi:MAG: EF-hand domain-containing protein [Bacteroidota bacterium]